MKTFHNLLVNTIVSTVANNFVWFALTFWAYLITKNVIATAIMAGIFTTTTALSGFFLGTLVDRFPKKAVMLASSLATLVLFSLAWLVFVLTPAQSFTTIASPQLWVFVVLSLGGAIAGNLRGIALSTLVTILVPEESRDKANGLVGTATGIAFFFASIFSGLAIGFIGVSLTLLIAIAATILVVVHLFTIPIPAAPKVMAPQSGAEAAPGEAAPASAGAIDLRGTIRAIAVVPGLFGLIFFHTFNNFLGGVFMSLMDAYGLELVSVQFWGALFGILSLGFIVGGIVVARKGLGKNPLRTLFLCNLAMWAICSVFTLQASIWLMAAGMFVWLCLIPAVEAAEQTILQKVVPPERQGRVFGFAQSVELSASPITSFLIGPIAQLIFIPFMTTGAGVDLIGGWFGTGVDRGLAVLFTLAGLIGLGVTLLAMRSFAYRSLSQRYQRPTSAPELAPA
jgi:DHA3 family multidrug efflux protein-like MFS transporter